MSSNLTTTFAAAAFACALATFAHAAMTISNAQTKNVSCTSGVCTPTAGDANLNTGELQTMLVSSDVTVKSNAKAPDIGILDPLTWASNHRLTLQAKQSIRVQAPVVVEGTGGVTFITHPRTGGDYAFDTTTSGSLTFWDTSSSLIINGASFTLVKDIATLSGDVAANPSGNYALAGNYDASADGPYERAPVNVKFRGTFEGLGNAISNLTINAPTTGLIGLFSYVRRGGVLRDISLKNVSLYQGDTSFAYVGGLAGLVEDATVSQASVSGSISAGVGFIGGLIGFAAGTGRNVISHSHAAVSVKAGLNSYAGGLIGVLVGETTGSWATGSVSIGLSEGLDPPASAGGLVGYALAGQSSGSAITNSYATGAVSGKSGTRTGGFVGLSLGTVLISTSYASGPVHAGHMGARGGFAGYINVVDEADDYWDITTSGLRKGVGNYGNIDGITGLTDAQLKSALPAGFDPNVWGQSAGINNGWPYLLANPPQ